ncbi:hypothetical protein AB0N06_21995 [Streptomyces sp. NPDC051020]|uniref:hypothetical protein n=1 Tax=Streptomyces sp. NPDC051020 TaxID=3155409 RepID=UPI0034137593
MTGAGLYTKTENWDKTLGDEKIGGSAEVTSQGDKFTMTITVHAVDRYDFNKDMKDRHRVRRTTRNAASLRPAGRNRSW